MLKIDFVAPPFAGHLYPALELARGLIPLGKYEIRFLSTAGAKEAITSSGFDFVEILPGQDETVWMIADTAKQVGSNPFRMWKQVKQNLNLMKELQEQLQQEWKQIRPDLALVDFVIPVAGLTAQTMNISWWTGCATPCAIETQSGIPSYLGGWQPQHNTWGKVRDWSGRKLVREFKKLSAKLFSRQLRELGITKLYREEGTEVIYSSEKILGYGMKEFEFERDWPEYMEFIGPLPQSPPMESSSPEFIEGRKTVLITLGTHLIWAKTDALQLFREVAQLMPETTFHFSMGKPNHSGKEMENNLHIYDFIPYQEQLGNYDAAVIHGGTGITYSCIQSAVPMLVWPHDYDQFDHAARIVFHGLGRRLQPKVPSVVRDLKNLMNDTSVRNNALWFQKQSRSYSPSQSVHLHLKKLH